MKQFRSGEIKVLVATDVAARGLDIKAVKCGTRSAGPCRAGSHFAPALVDRRVRGAAPRETRGEG